MPIFNKMEDYSFKYETIDEVFDEIQDLLVDHWEEIALNQDTIELNPDWEKYRALEKDGRLGSYICRFKGELVGYFVVFADYHIHYKDHIFATNDIIFIKKEHRNAGVGAAFIGYVKERLADLGVSILIINTKAHQPFGPLLESLDFEEIETSYSISLTKGK